MQLTVQPHYNMLQYNAVFVITYKMVVSMDIEADFVSKIPNLGDHCNNVPLLITIYCYPIRVKCLPANI